MQLNRLHNKDIRCSEVPRMKRHRIKKVQSGRFSHLMKSYSHETRATRHQLLTVAAITQSAQLAMQLAVRTGSLAS